MDDKPTEQEAKTPAPKKAVALKKSRYMTKGLTPIARARNKQVAEAVALVGPGEAAVAEETGLTQGYVREVMARASFKELLAKELEKHGLGLGRYLKEVKKGLDEAKLDKHSFYVEQQAKLLGLDQAKEPGNQTPPVQINLLVQEMEKRGLT